MKNMKKKIFYNLQGLLSIAIAMRISKPGIRFGHRKPLMFETPCSIFFQLEIVLNWVFIVRENSRV
jgi:hypothetical protein